MTGERPLVVGFLVLRNAMASGQLLRVLGYARAYCDSLVVLDDASEDATGDYLEELGEREPDWLRVLVRVAAEDRAPGFEGAWRQLLLMQAHQLTPHWLFWLEGADVLDVAEWEGLRNFARLAVGWPEIAWAFHCQQVSAGGESDGGWPIKLWRWAPELEFARQSEVPRQIREAASHLIGRAPFEIVRLEK